jgi:hypothetical protein
LNFHFLIISGGLSADTAVKQPITNAKLFCYLGGLRILARQNPPSKQIQQILPDEIKWGVDCSDEWDGTAHLGPGCCLMFGVLPAREKRSRKLEEWS